MSLFATLDRYANRVALVEADGRSLTYGEMLAAGDGIAATAGKGRHLVVVVCRNDADCVAGYVGLVRAGAVVLMLHHSIQPEHLSDILVRFSPSLIYAPSGFVDQGCPVGRLGGYILSDLGPPVPKMHPDLTLLLTTSGTTGSRNFVRLTAANLSANAASIAEYLEIGHDERAITTMPLSYSFGLSILHSHLLQGARIVVTEESVVTPGFWKILRAQEVTSLSGVPFFYDMLKKLRFGRMDLPTLRTLTQAGGHMSSEMVTEFTDLCAASGRRLIVMYGQTEAAPRISWVPWEEIRRRPGSIGKAIPGGRLWLEEDGQRLTQPDMIGELIFAGDNVCLGYAAETQDLARGDDNCGILRTGDMATVDEDGFFTIVGRRKRFLKVFGHRVNLDDLESLLRRAGFECVCGGTDDRLRVYACGVEAETVKAAVIAHTGLSAHMFQVVPITEIPRQESGKVNYSALEAQYGGG